MLPCLLCSFGWLEFFLEGEKNLRVICGKVNPRIVVQSRNLFLQIFRDDVKSKNVETCCCDSDLEQMRRAEGAVAETSLLEFPQVRTGRNIS